MAVPPPAPHADKRALRAALRARRDAFGPGAQPPAPPALFLDRLVRGVVVASYAPVGGEASPERFEQAVRAAGGVVALPRVESRAAPLSFHRWDGEALERAAFGLLQPAATAARCAPDIILAPLVAFDAALGRLGQGGGHYDRAFAAFPDALRIGIAWSVQRVGELPTDPWDMPLDAVVTEDAVWTATDQ